MSTEIGIQGSKLTFLLLVVLSLLLQTTYASQGLVIGVDVGTESCRVGLFDETGKLIGQSSAGYTTNYPQTGHVEQNPADWWSCMGRACQETLATSGVDVDKVIGLCIDTTACSVVLLDENKEPLQPCILYNDARSAPQCRKIIELGRGDSHLEVCNAGRGPISAEWMLPKCLWVKENDAALWSSTRHVCEKNDYLNYRLTGRLVASGCNVAARWNWDAAEAVRTGADSRSGRPVSLLQRLDMEELLDKWPQECVAMGESVGQLSAVAAEHLGLRAGVPVTQGGPDAYVGMIGLGCIEPGQMALITGSTHLHLCVSDSPNTHRGIWGAYKGAPLAHLCFAEGGQSSTGSMVAWARRLLRGQGDAAALSYQTLDAEAAAVPAGCEGLLCLETFQGSRTPRTDPLARGALVGLSLFHTRGHVWRALLESVCYGTKSCLDAMEAAGHASREILVAGGATRSPLWLQMHSDVVGKPVVVGEFDNAPLLGSAVLAAVGAGLYPTVQAAVRAMVRQTKRVEPDMTAHEVYRRVHRLYDKLASAVEAVAHSLATQEHLQEPQVVYLGGVEVVPSVLAADLAALGKETKMCEAAVAWLHVDVFDGSPVCSDAFSFGPSAVEAIRRSSPALLLDVHVATARPAAILRPLVLAGADRITLQYEMFSDNAAAMELVREVRGLGVACGLCLAPSTPVAAVEELLSLRDAGGTHEVAFMNILAVAPGIGGQPFNETVLSKVRRIREIRRDSIRIAVDGGVSATTAPLCVAAGADVLIAGTGLFGRNRDADDSSSEATFLRNLAAIKKAAVAASFSS